MVLAGAGDEMGSPGRKTGRCGVAPAAVRQNLGVEAGSRKRKAAVLSRDSKSLAGNAGKKVLEVECEESRRVSIEIEQLRSELDEDVKELGYCEENEKLRAMMDLKDKEMQCLRKQNEELQAKYAKQIKVLHSNYKKKNEVEKYKKQIEVLQSNFEKQNEELQAKNVGLHKNIVDTLENQIDAKRKQLQKLDGLNSTMESSSTQLEELKILPHMSCDEDPNSKLVDESSAEKTGVSGKSDDVLLKRQKLEMEVAKLDVEIEVKMAKLGDLLEGEKFSEELGSATVWKSIEANMELQNIRRELIAGLKANFVGPMDSWVKRMGELDERIFRAVCRQRYGNDDADYRAILVLSHWREELKNPSWHPFKIVDADGKLKEVVDDEDKKLKQLRAEYGNELCNAVTAALIEMNEYNPNGRDTVLELWNYREGRKGTVMEVIRYLFMKLLHERRDREQQKGELQSKYAKQIEELQAKDADLQKSIADTLKNQIDAKQKQLRRLEGLYSTMQFSLAQLEECKKIPDKSCDEEPNSKLVDQSPAENGVNGEADDEKLKLETEVAKLDAQIEFKMEKLGEILEIEKIFEELRSVTNTKLLDIRREMIVGLEDNGLGSMDIGVKRMGEVDELTFRAACQRRYGNDEAEVKAAILACYWNKELKNPSWHPFKIVDGDGVATEVVDDNDEKLKQLRAEHGDDLYNAVRAALVEMKVECHQSGCYPGSGDFWNFREGRRATVKELLMYMFRNLRGRHRA